MKDTTKRILFTTDGSDCSFAAFEQAIAMAKSQNTGLIFLSIIPPAITTMSPYEGTVVPANLAEISKHKKIAMEKQILARITGVKVDVPFGIEVVEEVSPARAILTRIEEDDVALVVMATHGHTGLKHILFGSTVEKVVRRSPVPVLTVRSLPVPEGDPEWNEEVSTAGPARKGQDG